MKKIQHQLSKLEDKKKSVSVFDDVRNNLAYKRHRNEVNLISGYSATK